MSAIHPDAELLALCAQLAEMQAEWQRLWEPTSDEVPSTTEADHAWDRYHRYVWPCTHPSHPEMTGEDLGARLLTLRATTLEGMQAKAAAILAMEEASGYTWDCRDDSCQLATSLMEDVAGVMCPKLGADAPALPERAQP